MLWRVAVRSALSDAEPFRAQLLELVPEGFEEVERDGAIELVCYLDDATCAVVLRHYPDAATTAAAEGWEEAWRVFHRPVVAGGLWLGPPWEEPPDLHSAVVIEPARAFGTGAHPTTRLCVELLAELPSRGSLLDIGCGSGVLAIAGARLGYGPVRAIDVDPVAVETARANAAANGVAIDVSTLDALTDALPAADVAVANVLRRPVEALLRRLTSTFVVTSGYLATDDLATGGWDRLASRELDGWAADLLANGGIAGRSV
ncbi:MAG: 50S ribosomal protein L11 methyltransferase [Actinobacteria bacterium]|nr:50S ribosomal protein L11 methyltransferase [Actinomycetota bacterium]